MNKTTGKGAVKMPGLNLKARLCFIRLIFHFRLITGGLPVFLRDIWEYEEQRISFIGTLLLEYCP